MLRGLAVVKMALSALETVDIRKSTTVLVTSPESTQTNIVFLAWLTSDLVMSLYYNSKWAGWFPNLLHHVAGINFWYHMTDGGFAHNIGSCAVLIEATTPFVNQRFFFEKAGMKSSPLYVINGIAMTLLWFLLRVLLFGWIGLRLFQMRASLLTLPPLYFYTTVLSFAVGYALQLFWFSKIFKGALKVLLAPKSKST